MRAMDVPLKQKMASCEFLLGSFVFSTDPNVPAIYASAGFDFVIIDTEHGMNDVATTLGHLRSARASGIHALVRLGPANLADAARFLDAGCEGIMIPHFGLPGAGVTQTLRSTRYFPQGNRPTCGGVAAAGYGNTSFPAYVERANRDVLTVGLIEDRECLADLDGLMARREVEWVMPGPGDLATSFGVPGQLRHPSVAQAVDAIFDAANRHGVPLGMYLNNPEEIAGWHARGARFFVMSIDVKWLATSLKGAADACRRNVSRG